MAIVKGISDQEWEEIELEGDSEIRHDGAVPEYPIAPTVSNEIGV
jgi:hypothetical protein